MGTCYKLHTCASSPHFFAGDTYGNIYDLFLLRLISENRGIAIEEFQQGFP